MKDDKKDVKVFLKHILESIEKIDKYTKNVSKDGFVKSDQLQDSVIRRLEIVEEAAKHMPTSLKRKYPDVAWKRERRLREFLKRWKMNSFRSNRFRFEILLYSIIMLSLFIITPAYARDFVAINLTRNSGVSQ